MTVREMTGAEFDQWRDDLARAHADEQAAAANGQPDDAVARGLDETAVTHRPLRRAPRLVP